MLRPSCFHSSDANISRVFPTYGYVAAEFNLAICPGRCLHNHPTLMPIGAPRRRLVIIAPVPTLALDLHFHVQHSNCSLSSPTVKGPSTCAVASALPFCTRNDLRAHTSHRLADTEPVPKQAPTWQLSTSAADDILLRLHRCRVSRRLPELFHLLTEQ